MTYSMLIIEPTTVTDAMFISSTVPETDATPWNPSTPYVVGNKAMRAVSGIHRVFERIVAGTTATSPESDTVNWLNIAPTNRWAIYDNKIGTKTSSISPITNVLSPGAVGGISFRELIGKSLQVTLKDAIGGTIIYDKTIDLDGTIIDSVYDWFFNPYVQLTDINLTDLPCHYFSPELTTSLTGTSTVECGVCKFGQVHGIGDSQLGAVAGIIDYGVKEKDQFGNYSYNDKGFSKRNTFNVITQKSDFNRIFRLLSRLRGKLCIYIGEDSDGFEPLTSYGAFKDFSIAVTYKYTQFLSIEIEGMI